MPSGPFTLQIFNQTPQPQAFTVFVLPDPGRLPQQTSVLVWMTGEADPTKPVDFRSDGNCSIAAGTMPDGFGPPARFSEQTATPVGSGGGVVDVTCPGGVLILSSPPEAGPSIVVRSDSSIPQGQSLAVGLVVANAPVAVCPLNPNQTYVFPPDLRYAIAAVQIQAGEVIQPDGVPHFVLPLDGPELTVDFLGGNFFHAR